MKTHEAHAVWTGNLKDGRGKVDVGSGAFEGEYDFDSRFAGGSATTPEELLGAAHAGCYSMALSNMLAEAGHRPKSIDTRAKVRLKTPDDDGGPGIEEIALSTVGDVPGVDAKTFDEFAERARTGCLVSKVLKGAKIEVEARLQS